MINTQTNRTSFQGTAAKAYNVHSSDIQAAHNSNRRDKRKPALECIFQGKNDTAVAAAAAAALDYTNDPLTYTVLLLVLLVVL